MNTPDPILDLLADLPPVVPAADLGPRARQRAAVLRRRHRLLAGAGVLAVAVSGALTTVALAGGGDRSVLKPAPVAGPSTAGPSQSVLDVPRCASPPGGGSPLVPGAPRRPQEPVSSVDQNTYTASGYLPEVEQAVADTAPAGFIVSCASDGDMVLRSPDRQEAYLEVRYSLTNPLYVSDREEYYTRPDPGVKSYRTPAGARVRLAGADNVRQLSAPISAEIFAGRYQVNLSSRSSSWAGWYPPPKLVPPWVDRLGDRLAALSAERPPVTVDLPDLTPNPAPQAYVDRAVATAPGPVTVQPDLQSTSIELDSDVRAELTIVNTAAPFQDRPFTAKDVERVRGVIEGPEQGWPSSALVIVVDRGGIGDAQADQSFFQFLIQDGDVKLQMTTDANGAGPGQLRAWAKAMLAAS